MRKVYQIRKLDITIGYWYNKALSFSGWEFTMNLSGVISAIAAIIRAAAELAGISPEHLLKLVGELFATPEHSYRERKVPHPAVLLDLPRGFLFMLAAIMQAKHGGKNSTSAQLVESLYQNWKCYSTSDLVKRFQKIQKNEGYAGRILGKKFASPEALANYIIELETSQNR